MKHLSATNMVAETGADEFASTPISTALTVPKFRDGISYLYARPSSRIATLCTDLTPKAIMWLDPHSIPSPLT